MILAEQGRTKALEEKLQALRHKHILSVKEQDSLRKQLEESRAETARMQMLKDEAREFLLSCLDDARKQFAVQTGESKEWSPDQPIPWSLQGLSMPGREALLEYLLARLGGTNFGGKASTTGRSTRQARRGESPMGGAMTPTSQADGNMLPPISAGRSSPALSGPPNNLGPDNTAGGVFGTWGAKANNPYRHKA